MIRLDLLETLTEEANLVKKYTLALLIAIIAPQLLTGCSRGYESQKNAEDLKITLYVARYPLVKGDNNLLTMKVDDATGAVVSDAAVKVHYFMPPMPGMAPMDYWTDAVRKGALYVCSVNIPMEGGWKAEVSVMRQGKYAVMTTFNLDSR